jgi:D-aspartate ligase
MVSRTNKQTKHDHSVEVIVTGGRCVDNLGVIRGLGKRGIPVIYLDSEPGSMVRYSRYISKRLACPSLKQSEAGFVNLLLEFGKQIHKKMMIIPTGDREIIALSKYKEELERSYLLPVPPLEVAQKLVNKKNFYKLLAEMQIPHPKTYFIESLTELRLTGRQIAYPYIIKPVDSFPFREEFGQKCFVINSSQELDQAVDRLISKNLEVMIQEIIPGKEIYMAYIYFNKTSEPLAVCGYDKLRQFPPDFGSGSLCRSAWRPTPINLAIQILTAIGYHGMAEPEFKTDPRDGKYKLLEINARTTTENRLPAGCGVDIEYIAYLDATGQNVEDLVSPSNGILWVDDFYDLFSCLIQLKEGKLGIRDIFKSLKGKKIHSVAAWDDPIPFLVYSRNISLAALRRLLPI